MCGTDAPTHTSQALRNADPAVRARFEANGEPFVIVDDKVVS